MWIYLSLYSERTGVSHPEKYDPILSEILLQIASKGFFRDQKENILNTVIHQKRNTLSGFFRLECGITENNVLQPEFFPLEVEYFFYFVFKKEFSWGHNIRGFRRERDYIFFFWVIHCYSRSVLTLPTYTLHLLWIAKNFFLRSSSRHVTRKEENRERHTRWVN